MDCVSNTACIYSQQFFQHTTFRLVLFFPGWLLFLGLGLGFVFFFSFVENTIDQTEQTPVSEYTHTSKKVLIMENFKTDIVLTV